MLRHASSVSFVTVDERGRRPISPTMATRYADALGVVEELAAGNVPDDVRARLSELRGMAARCLALDQYDWLDVWHVLGSPDRARLNLLWDLAVNANRASASGTPDLDRFRAELERSGWAEGLAGARRTIEARIRAGALTATENEQDRPDSAQRPMDPELPVTSVLPVPSETPAPSEPKEAETMTTTKTAPTAPEKAGPSTGLLQALEASAAADRTCKTHEAVRFELMAALLRADRQPDSSRVVDVDCVTDDGHLLYEVLGAGLTSYADLRSGAARLQEINHALTKEADRLCLVLAGPPAEDWSAATLHDVFGVHVLWRTQQGWAGRDTEAALGTGQA